MYMVFTFDAFEDPNILGSSDLDDELTTAFLDISFKNLVAIFGHPNDMNRKTANRVTPATIL